MPGNMTVSQFDELIKRTVSSQDALRDVFVTGEISECKTASSGHMYFTLKDGTSILRCNMWKTWVGTLKFKPDIGLKVTAFGSVDFYAQGGQLNFIVRNLSLFGEGEQKKALEELTNKLLKEGLFEPERKRKLPKYPRVIGVVTSETGAVIKDIINTAKLQFPADILLAPAVVQGEGADLTMIHALELLNKADVDVIIIGRGGGSKEDLSAFNSEPLVRAIANSKAPVISAVGHATDKSLTDRVADMYAETPTQAAMLALLPMDQVRGELRGYEMRASKALTAFIDKMRGRFSYPDARLDKNSPSRYIERQRGAFEKTAMRMESTMTQMISTKKNAFSVLDAKLMPSKALNMVNEGFMRLDSLSGRMDVSIAHTIDAQRNKLESIGLRLEADNPGSVLKRGYSYISDDSGRTVTSVTAMKKGTMITVKMRDGKAKAEVKEVLK